MIHILSSILTAPALALPCPPVLGLLNDPLKAMTIIGLLGIGGIVMTGVIVVAAFYFQNRKRQQWHETARLALEKGQPLPPWPKSDEELELTPPPGASLAEWEALRRVRSQRGSLKGGLILIAVGAGLYIMMGTDAGRAGAIPALIGVAMIVYALIEKFSAGRGP